MKNNFYRYKLKSSALHIGDRYKGSIFKPTVDYLRSTTITFAIRKYFNDKNLYAYGKKINGIKKIITRNPLDRCTKSGKTSGARGPIQIEIIENAETDVIINKNLGDRFEIKLGGFLNLGLGESSLELVEEIKELNLIKVELESAIPVNWIENFNIKNILSCILGYLHIPDENNPLSAGFYIKSCLPGSIVIGPNFLGRKLN